MLVTPPVRLGAWPPGAELTGLCASFARSSTSLMFAATHLRLSTMTQAGGGDVLSERAALSTNTPRWRRLVGAIVGRPVLTSVVVALGVRVSFALWTFVVHSYLIPDEIQYVALAKTVASGHTAEQWVQSYGQSLYDSTWAFMAPLTFLFRLLGPSRLWGQLIAVLFGAATAGLAAALTGLVTPRRTALFAGLVVALMPSQVIWSSVVLRESMVWAALALVGLGVALASRASNLLFPVALIAAGLLALGVLREQTLIAAAWSLPIALLVGATRGRLGRFAAGLALAGVVPLVAGYGVAGWSVVRTQIPALAVTRTNMALNANSAFTPATLVMPPSVDGVVPPSVDGVVPTTVRGAKAVRPRSGQDWNVAQGKVTFADGSTAPAVIGSQGEVYSVDNSVGGNIDQGFGGLIATTLRPWPGESLGSRQLLATSFENLLWYALYVLALVGALSFRRTAAVTAFPILVSGAIVVIAALTQGNLGTAFRHRGQLLWAIAILAAIGLERLRSARSTSRGPIGLDDEVEASEVMPVHRPARRTPLRSLYQSQPPASAAWLD